MWNIDMYKSGTEVWVHHFNTETNRNEFVARFKYRNAKRSANHFVKFLTKNFTPQEYFGLLATRVPPVTALATKGYVSYNVLKLQ